MKHDESYLQRLCHRWFCHRWFCLQYPKMKGLLFAVPNGGARNKTEARILKSEGVTAGVSDMILLTPRGIYGSLCIEFKIDKGRQSESQKKWQSLSELYGNRYIICRSLDDFIREINNYLQS